jgi:hypothetical protein
MASRILLALGLLLPLQQGILARNRLSRKVCANWSGFFGFFQENYGSKNCVRK